MVFIRLTPRFGRIPLRSRGVPPQRSGERRHHATVVAFAGLVATAIAACSEPEAPSFQVAGVPVPEAEYLALPPAERQTLLDLVSLGSAIAAGERDPIIQPLIARAEDAALVPLLPAALAARSMALEEADLREGYARSPEWELEVRHMVRLVEPTADEEARDGAREVAERVAAEAAGGADFAQLAARWSEEPGAAERGGLLDPGREGSWVQPFWEAAAMLEPGQSSGVVETIYGYHVLHLDARRPVPFEEVPRGRLLRRAVPADAAADAMGAWSASQGSILLDPPALQQALDSILAGAAPPAELTVATGAGATYTGEDLAAGWARLAPDQRAPLERGDLAGLAGWAESEAREMLWADAARELDLQPPANVAEEARATWDATLDLWAQLLGFREGMQAGEVYQAARQATLSGEPEVRARRAEVRSLRPLLRLVYPVAPPAG